MAPASRGPPATAPLRDIRLCTFGWPARNSENNPQAPLEFGQRSFSFNNVNSRIKRQYSEPVIRRTMKRLIVLFALLAVVIMSATSMAQRGGGPPPAPPAPGPMLEIANKIVEAINKQDAATLQKMSAPDAIYLDEDGHAPPVMAW